MVRAALNLGYFYAKEKQSFAFDKNTFTVSYKEALMDRVNSIGKMALFDLNHAQ